MVYYTITAKREWYNLAMFFGCRESGEKNGLKIYNSRYAAIIPQSRLPRKARKRGPDLNFPRFL